MNKRFIKAKSNASAALARVGVSMTINTIGGESYTGMGLLEEAKKFNKETAEVTVTTKIYLTGTNGVAPLPGDLITIGSARYVVDSVTEVNPNGDLVLFFELGVSQ